MNVCNLESFYLIHTWKFDPKLRDEIQSEFDTGLFTCCACTAHVENLLDRDSHLFKHFIYDLGPFIHIHYYNGNLIQSVGLLPLDRPGSPNQTQHSASSLIW